MALAGAALATILSIVGVAALTGITTLSERATFEENSLTLTNELGGAMAPGILSVVETAPGEERDYNFQVLRISARKAVEPFAGRLLAYAALSLDGEILVQSETDLPALDFASINQPADGDYRDGYALFSAPASLAGGREIGNLLTAWSTEEIDRNLKRNLIAGAIIVLIGSIGASFVMWVLATRLVKAPIMRMNGAMSSLASGDYDVTVETRGDVVEIKSMGNSIDALKRDLKDSRAAREQAAEQRAQAQEERQRTLQDLVSTHETTVGEVISRVVEAANTLHDSAKQLSETANMTTARSGEAVESATSSRQSVTSITEASQDISDAAREVGSLVGQGEQVAKSAIERMEGLSKAIHDLDTEVTEIGTVITMITDIAEQTNLLALNATIESARAGEAGKGFAVVAGEVKSLSGQTHSATDEISNKIKAIQDRVHTMVQGVETAAETIRELAQNAGTINSAVDRQVDAMQFIGVIVEEVGQKTDALVGSADQVSSAANATGEAANQVFETATQLLSNAENLSQ
ncbi:MAG: methyl-accepting chemotaxis protein, partial [Pseudomonadota bacterium]